MCVRRERVEIGLCLCECTVEERREMRGGGKEDVDEIFGCGVDEEACSKISDLEYSVFGF